MESRFASVFNWIARRIAPSGLKKALSFRAAELALQEQCEPGGEVVRLASLERVQQRPHPERRFGDQHEMFQVTKISSKDRILILARTNLDRMMPNLTLMLSGRAAA